MKFKFKNIYLILFLLFVVFLSSYFSTAGTFTNLYTVEGMSNINPAGTSDSIINKTNNLTDINSNTITQQNTIEMPMGISRDMIPEGEEDLYILKSQVVPPVCPACPTVSACPRQEPPPPCPQATSKDEARTTKIHVFIDVYRIFLCFLHFLRFVPCEAI